MIKRDAFHAQLLEMIEHLNRRIKHSGNRSELLGMSAHKFEEDNPEDPVTDLQLNRIISLSNKAERWTEDLEEKRDACEKLAYLFRV